MEEEKVIEFCKIKDFKYYSVSAKDGTNVKELFKEISESLIKSYKDQEFSDTIILESKIIEKEKSKCGC